MLYYILTKKLNKWAAKTFPNQTIKSKTIHLRKEVDELLEAIEKQDIKEAHVEMADIFILIVNIAFISGLSPFRFLLTVKRKLDVNLKRNWHKADSDGVYHHKDK